MGSVEMTYDRRHSGIATIYADGVGGDTRRVELRTLDELVSPRRLGPRDLLKFDVEGNQLDVLRGTGETIAPALPAILFDLNERAASVAGWTLAEAAQLLLSLAGPSFYLIDEHGTRPLDPVTFQLEPDERLDPHVDVLARPTVWRR